MRKQDLIVLGIIVFITGIISFVVSGKFITPNNEKIAAETVSAVEATFQIPDSTVFNSEAINPTVKIQIAPQANTNPFTNPN